MKMNHAKKIKMLGKFDPLLVSYKNKEWIADKEFIKTIWGKGGQIEAVIIINNRIVGTWRYKVNKKNMDFNIKLFSPLSSGQEKSIGQQSKRIATFYGKELGEIHIENSRPIVD
jgi:hypothetical protein